MRFVKFLAAAALFGAFAGPAAAADYYSGKTVKIIIGQSPGGTVDTLARSFAQIWEKQIPGKPQFIVESVTGGGGLKATNYVFKAKPDGLVLLFGPWQPVSEILGDEILQAKHAKFEYIGGLSDVRLQYSRTDVVPGGLQKPADIMKAQGLKLGGSNVAGIPDLLSRMMLDVLGVKHTYVVGFTGGSDLYAAMNRNEIHTANASISSFRQRSGSAVEAGQYKGIAYVTYVEPNGTFKRYNEITEMPHFIDLYKEIHGKMPSGSRWDTLNWFVGLTGEMSYVAFAPPGTPKAAVDELRTSFNAGCKDKEFVGPQLTRYGIAHECLSLQEGTRIIKSIDSVDPKVLDGFKAVIKEAEK